MEETDENNYDIKYYLYLYNKLHETFINFNKILEKPNEGNTKKLQENKNYKNFLLWLELNGVIYTEALNYPVSFGPFGLVGVSAKENLQNYKSILYVPKKIIIDSEEIKNKSYLSILFSCQDAEFIKESNILIMTIFLLYENLKKEKSFFKPYIDMIDLDNPIFWKLEQLQELDDQGLIDSIIYTKKEMSEYYEKIKFYLKKKIIDIEYQNLYTEKEDIIKNLNFSELKNLTNLFLSEITLDIFMKFYNFVLSRNFMVNDYTSQLVPLADSLNHSEVDVYYEYYDSFNFISKYTLEFDDNAKKLNKTNHDLFYSFTNNKNSTEIMSEKNLYSSDEQEDDNKIKLTEYDFFTISTGAKQNFSKNAQVYNFYGRYSNEYLISNYGFTKFLNKYDKLKFTMNYEKNDDDILEKLINYYFKKNYVPNSDFLVMRFKLKAKKINHKFFDFLRFLIVYEDIDDEKDLYKLTELSDEFDINIEIQVLNRALEILVKTLTKKCLKYKIHDDIITLNDLINNKNNKYKFKDMKNISLIEEELNNMRNFNCMSFRVTQKYMVLFHIKYIYFILEILCFSVEKNVSVKQAYLNRFSNYEKDEGEFCYNRKVIKKYFIKKKIKIEQK